MGSTSSRYYAQPLSPTNGNGQSVIGNGQSVIGTLERERNIYVIDSDHDRRAEIASQLARQNLRPVACSSAADLWALAPARGVILIHHDDALINALNHDPANAGRKLPYIVFSENPTTRQVVRAVQNGAADYFAWPFHIKDLVNAILELKLPAGLAKAANLHYPALANRAGSMATQVDGTAPSERILRLTKREQQVLVCIADGLSNIQIGEHLGISSRTVECHRAKTLAKLGAKNSASAVHIALAGGLI